MDDATRLPLPASPRYRILFVDYEGPIVSYMKGVFGAAGIRADHTDLGEDGVDLAVAGSYDMVVAASNLADISGYEIVRRLRGSGWKAPVVIMTGCTDPDMHAKLFDLGADGIVIQPYSGKAMVAHVRAHLRRWAVLGARPESVKDDAIARAIRIRDWRPRDEAGEAGKRLA